MGKIAIEEAHNGIIVSRKLEKTEHVNAIEMDILGKNEIALLGIPEVVSRFGATTLRFRLPEVTTLTAIFRSGIGFGMFCTMISQLAKTMQNCIAHGVRSNNLELRSDLIFVEPARKQLHLLFWPLTSLDEPQDVCKAFCLLGEQYAAKPEDEPYRRAYLALFDTRTEFSVFRMESQVRELSERWLSERTEKAQMCGARQLSLYSRELQTQIPIGKTPFVIGRIAEICDYACPRLPMMSRSHFTISERGGTYYCVDNRSKNGTRINDVLISANEQNATELHDGDVIRAGGATFRCNIQ